MSNEDCTKPPGGPDEREVSGKGLLEIVEVEERLPPELDAKLTLEVERAMDRLRLEAERLERG